MEVGGVLMVVGKVKQRKGKSELKGVGAGEDVDEGGKKKKKKIGLTKRALQIEFEHFCA